MPVLVQGNEITLAGAVGGCWAEECFTYTDVVGALAEVGRAADIVVHLNSGGGDVTDGSAIWSALSSHKGNVHIVVEGWAASAASLIAMAGDTVSMAKGAMLMVHDPSCGTWGTASEHRKSAAVLDALAETYAGVYSDKCKKAAAEVRQIMKDETWYRPEEAVAAGFADDVLSNSEEIEPTAFSGVKAYARAPERIVALAQSRGWCSRAQMAATSAAPNRPKEESMTEQTKADDQPTAEEIEAKAKADAEAKAKAEAEAEAAKAAEPAAIAEACEKAGFAMLTASLLKQSGVTMAAVSTRLADAKTISDACAAVGVPAMASDLIASGVSVEMARKLAFAAKAGKETPSDTAHREPAAAASTWDSAIAKANALGGFGRK